MLLSRPLDILVAGLEGTFKMIFSTFTASKLSCVTWEHTLTTWNYGVSVRYIDVFPMWTFSVEYVTSPNVSDHGQMPNKCYEWMSAHYCTHSLKWPLGKHDYHLAYE